jgi:O-antigen/teichoic acid export membrane protein
MAESRTQKTARNIIFGIGNFFVSFLASYVSRIIFLKILDAGYLGINGLFSNIINILSLADLGIGTAMMYSLYTPIAQKDITKVNSLIAFFRKIYLIIAVIVLCAGLLLLPFLDSLINLEKPIEHVNYYYVLALLNTVISYLFVYRTTLITADQKNYVLSKYTMIIRLCVFAVQTAVLVMTENYFLYLLSALIITFLGNLLQNHIAMKMYPFLREKAQPLEKENRKKIYSDVKSLFLYRFCGIIQSHTNNILISIMVGTIFVGYYSNYLIVTTMILSFLSLLYQSLKASVGNMMAEDKSNDNKKRIFDVLEYINFVVVTVCSIGCAVMYQDFIGLSFGKEYQLSFWTVMAVVVNFYTSNIRQNLWIFRETTGIFNEMRYITLITAFIDFGLSIIMGKLWGLAGILWATVVARMVYSWWREPMIMYKKIFDTSCLEYLKTYTLRIIIAIAIYMGVNYLCALIIVDNVYLQFLIRGLSCLIITIVLLWLTSFKTREFKYCYQRFALPMINKIKKK